MLHYIFLVCKKWKFSLCSLWGKHVIKHRRSEEFVLAVVVAGNLLHLTLAFCFFEFLWRAFLELCPFRDDDVTSIYRGFNKRALSIQGVVLWAFWVLRVWICSKHTLVEKTEIKLTLMTPGFMAHARSAGVVPLFPSVAEGWKYPTQCPSLICSSITFSHVGSSFCCLAWLQLCFPPSAKSAF